MLSISNGLKGVTLAMAFVAGAAPTGALSQGVLNRPTLSAALANEVVGYPVPLCAPKGLKVWAVLVKDAGRAGGPSGPMYEEIE